MLCYYFAIKFYVDNLHKINNASYKVEESNWANAWRKATEYAIETYADHLCMIELHHVSTY